MDMHGFGTTNRTLCGDRTSTVYAYGEGVTANTDQINCAGCLRALATTLPAPAPAIPGMTWVAL